MDQKQGTPVKHRCNRRFVLFYLLSKEKEESLLYALSIIEHQSEC